MQIDILTLFPDMFPGVLNSSILNRAREKGKFNYNVINFREYADNKHEKVDDYPYGGGAGMVLTAQPIFDAVDAVIKNKPTKPRIILMCPQGKPYNQEKAEELAQEDLLVYIPGHYEGYEERNGVDLATDEIAVGVYVLNGGALGALVVMHGIYGLIPHVLRDD